MNQVEKWLIENNFFSKLSLALSIICFIHVTILPIEKHTIHSIIYIWLSYSILNEILNKKI